MEDDVQRLYAANIRISSDAYDYLLHHQVSRQALRFLILSESPILSMDDVRAAMSEGSKIPMPEPTHHIIEAAKAEPPAPQKELPAPTRLPSPSATPSPRPTVPSSIIESRTPLQNSTSPSMPSPSSFSASRMRASGGGPQGQAPPAPKPDTPISASPPWVGKKSVSEVTPSPAISPTPAPSDSKPAVIVEVARASSYHPIAKDFSPKITIHEHRDVSGQSRCVGSVDDFVAYFRDRFVRECEILRTRACNLTIIRTDQLSMHPNEEVRLLVMVVDKRITKNGNLLLDVEDPEGSVRAIVSKSSRQFETMRTILKDDVIALDGKMGPNFFSATAVTWPDLPLVRATPKVEEDLAIAYLSDTHIGSRYFMEKAFKRFIRWLWGEEGTPELAGKVKYIVIAGDVCDGIGVYPTQEKELTIKDIFAQYAAFDELVETLPDHIEVIVSPGNHDAVRRGEPQPYIPMELIKTDVKKIGSPSSLEIEGLKHLVYHGTSLDSVIANISGLSYAKPEGPMMEILKRRHLSPIYGENLIVPELRDYMMIDQEPDVVHMGHIHKNCAMKYRGTLMINSGTFQERTDFQVKMGHIPSPGIVPILELKDQKLSHLKFLEETL